MELVSVAAVGDDLAIGADGGLPWDSLPRDKAQYRRRVAGSIVILGRRTFESMQGDLPGVIQIVLSRSARDYDVPSAHHADGVESALEVAATRDEDTAYVLGGAEIYELFQPHLDRMVLSRVTGSYDGDRYYPQWKSDEWSLVAEESYPDFAVETWERQRARR
ncbi:MAG: dihydrofolate reductase [uncultured archaeon A07HR60]|nr:MAG: dihydrofolate reductase [uncultured archaeon A07HR60]